MTVLLVACTPQQMLMNALVPDGTVSMLLSHLQDVESSNRQRIVELEQKGEWTELAKFADANIAKDPFSAEWQLIGGYAQLQQRNYPRAIEYFSEMVRLAPDEAAGYHFLAEAQRAAGDPQRAVVTLERALLVLRNSALTHRLLGDAYVDLNRDVTAMAAYRRALAIAPEMEAAWWGLGRVAVRAGRSADAREALRALAQMQSPHAATLRALIEAKS